MGEAARPLEFDVHEQWPTPHLKHVLNTWIRIKNLATLGRYSIDGQSLDVASVVALSRYGCSVSISEQGGVQSRIEQNVKTLQDYLSNGYFLYGVNTGFGGSAGTRTKDLLGLQRALMQLVQSGILTKDDMSGAASTHEYLESHSMPSAWTRATILIRCNANIRGHSAMTRKVVDTMIELLQSDIIPVIPLRGSLSASGDLMPLSYIAGAIQGNPDVHVRVGGKAGESRVIPAEQALKERDIEPIVLGPKEGLSLINGTAAAAAVSTLGLHEAHHLAVLSQLLTALTSEALYANAEWAHPFIAAVRPHRGQIEAAQNIRTFLKGSKLVYGLEETKNRFMTGLAQPRYALRSSPQWLSPQLEDLLHADLQLTTELNSTSDNPVVNSADGDIHCGANFQAAVVTSATEKVRLALQSIGKMLFAQTGEMINSDYNNGLPPDLAADDPSLSFCLKGLDASSAAYMSELAFLANPVSNHVQSAESHNQSINSLGLLSSRQTMAAVEVLSMIVANCLYTGCQGVDLRTLHRTFLEQAQEPMKSLIKSSLHSPSSVDHFWKEFWPLFEDKWYGSAALDAAERCDTVSEALGPAFSASPHAAAGLTMDQVTEMKQSLSKFLLTFYVTHREDFLKSPTTSQRLGSGTKVLYLFVRHDLGVPLHRGLVEHPVAGEINTIDGRPKRTIGSWVSVIYEALRDGSLFDHVSHYLQGDEHHDAIDGTKGTRHDGSNEGSKNEGT